MSERELLELAAKAAGMRIRCSDGGSFDRDDGEHWRAWNPLTDDGDALRLAVKLNMTAGTFERLGYSSASVIKPDGKELYAEETINNDPYAATRRAIVRAAAEIGKAMA